MGLVPLGMMVYITDPTARGLYINNSSGFINSWNQLLNPDDQYWTKSALNTDLYYNIAGTGRVGIGTASPTYKLHVEGTDSAALLLHDSTQLALDSRVDLDFKTGAYYTGRIRTTGLGTTVARVGFYTGTSTASTGMSERLTIANTGRVGIGGTTDPQYPLHYAGVGNGFVQTGVGVSPAVGTYVNSTGGWLQTLNAYPLLFATNNGAAQMTLSTAGDLGIGTQTPSARLDVDGSVRLRSAGTPIAGRVLTATDALGNATWQTPPAIPVNPAASTGFHAALNTAGNYTLVSDGNNYTLPFVVSGAPGTTLEYDDGADWNNASKSYIAPAAGVYQFHLALYFGILAGPASKPEIFVEVRRNGTTIIFASQLTDNFTGTNWPSVHNSFTAKLAPGDAVQVQVYSYTAVNVPLSNQFSSFQGFRVY